MRISMNLTVPASPTLRLLVVTLCGHPFNLGGLNSGSNGPCTWCKATVDETRAWRPVVLVTSGELSTAMDLGSTYLR